MAPSYHLGRMPSGWNAFEDQERISPFAIQALGMSTGIRPDKVRLSRGTERSIVAGIYNKIAIDCAAMDIRHVRLDENDRYSETIQSRLNTALTLSANIDQIGRNLIQDAVISMFEEGVVALAPIDTTEDPNVTGSYDIESIRVGKIIAWYPRHVRLRVYNDRTGKQQEITMPKDVVAIIENPLSSVMNEPNSTLQRLIKKLNLLDVIDEQSGSGKLDLILQLPQTIRSDKLRDEAEKRRRDIQLQLKDEKFGVAYVGATERITQLNRPIENNLMTQIEYLTSMLFSQLGMTKEVFEGTADEAAMLNYMNSTVSPILTTIVLEMTRKYLTKTARTQKQRIMYFIDPFRLVPVKDLAEIADKFTRNEVMTSNEFRSVIGYKPSSDPRADELRNKNLNASNDQLPAELPETTEQVENETS